MAQTTPLRRRMLDDMTVRNLSPATQQSPTPRHGRNRILPLGNPGRTR